MFGCWLYCLSYSWRHSGLHRENKTHKMPTGKRKTSRKQWKQPEIIDKRPNHQLGFNALPTSWKQAANGRWFLHFQQMVPVFPADGFCISCRWFLYFQQMVSVFSWCRLRWPRTACLTTARAGVRKRTCFMRHCPYTRTHHNRSYPVFGKKFNTLTALFAHQPPASPQKIDSREGWFWCKTGLVVNATKMYFYLIAPPFAPVFGLFVAKFSAICGKTQCILVQNTR